MPRTDADPALIADLVTANHILFAHGVLDAFGHCSVRHDKRADRFLMARNMAPALVGPDDIMEFELDGTPVDDERSPYLERFIHGSIFRERPDVSGVVHSHSAGVIPFGIVQGVTLRPVAHMSSFLIGGAPVFEIRDAAGDDNDMLVRNDAQGRALARTLGDAPVVLMRGHGSCAVGASIKHAVFRAIYTEINARLQAEASRLGPLTYLSEREARNSVVSNESQIARAWDLWRLQRAPSLPSAP